MTQPPPPFAWAQAPTPQPLSLVQAVRIHALVQIRRSLYLRVIWPWLAVHAALVLGGWAILHWSVESGDGFDKYLRDWGMNAIALVALGLGTGALKQDAEAGALGFFLLRPRGPVALPIGRWLAVTVIAGALGLTSVTLLWVGSQGTTLAQSFTDLLRLWLAAVLAAAAYSASFLAIAVWFRAAIGVAVAWLVVLDGLAKASDAFATLSPSHYLAAILGADVNPPTSLPGAVLALTLWTVVLLGACVARLQRDPPVTQNPSA